MDTLQNSLLFQENALLYLSYRHGHILLPLIDFGKDMENI
jgi:hypothetical protein